MHVELRPWRMDDAPVMAAMADNPKVAANLRDGFPAPYTLADAEAFIAMCLKADEDRMRFRAVLADGGVVGSISLTRMDNIYRRTGEIGYFLAEPYWGRGIAAQAIACICEEGFRELHLLRIFAEPFAGNGASRRALEKAGFQLEGIQRQHGVKNGVVLDSCIYARLRRDG